MLVHISRSPGSAAILAVVLLFASVSAGSCRRGPLVAPAGSVITLLTSRSLVAVDGSAEITAVVIEGAQGSGTPTAPGQVVAGVGTPVHDGTSVYFSSNLGRIEPAEAQTRGGRAVVSLIAEGRSGTATITAFSGGTMNTLAVDIGAAGATRVSVTANPQSLPSSGGSSVISARVEDQQGNGIGGIAVSFSTTKGNLSATTVVTNGDGVASTTLTTTAEAVVTASTGGSATALNGSVTVTVGS